MPDLQKELKLALKRGIANKRFDARKFFQAWFRQNGEPFFFLFTKNLKVTNMQVAELHALLRNGIVWRDTGKPVRDFQLLSVHEFYDSAQSLFDSFGTEDPNRSAEILAELYTDLIRDIVCIQLFFGSCAIFLPQSMKLDLLPICAESGYLHSCGPSIWNRNIAKATKQEMFHRLKEHLNQKGIEKAQLVVYAHEDFTRHDRKYAQELKDGLDDVKLHLEKYYIGKESLVQVLKETKNDPELKDRIELAEPDHYQRGLASTLPVVWLLVERQPSNNIRHRGDEQYYILYEQAYKNENTLHLFDENKPAWIDHTTIPHTLMGAMINITRPWWPEHRTPVLGDPFLGTGTTWLESLKYNITGHYGDKEPLAPEMVHDNLKFFCANDHELLKLSGAIYIATSLRTTLTEIDGKRSMEESDRRQRYHQLLQDEDFCEQASKDYHWGRRMFNLACPDDHQRDIRTDELLETFHEATLQQHLFFYLWLRSHRRNFTAIIDRETGPRTEAFRKEAQELLVQMEALQYQRTRQQSAEVKDNYLLWQGKYSRCCTVRPTSFQDALATAAGVITYTDAMTFGAGVDRPCDLIICDPPYGLNAEHGAPELATLYQTVLEKIVQALRDGGQLVLAVPDWSYIGKQVPFFVTKHFITQHVLAIAEREHREVVQTAHSVPSPRQAFHAPYYWESERALRRAILHFRFRDRATKPASAK